METPTRQDLQDRLQRAVEEYKPARAEFRRREKWYSWGQILLLVLMTATFWLLLRRPDMMFLAPLALGIASAAALEVWRQKSISSLQRAGDECWKAEINLLLHR